MKNTNKSLQRFVALGVLSVLLLSLLHGCSSRDERKVEYLNRAEQHFAEQNYDKARIDVRNALQIDENFVEARYLYARLFEVEQNWQQMVGNLRAVLEIDENHTEARLKYGTILLAARAFDDSTEQADLVITQEPENAEAYALKAAGQFQQGNNTQATRLAQQALAFDPSNISAVAVLTEVHKTENPELALASIEQGLTQQSDATAFELMRISVFEANNQIDEAINTYRSLIAEHPDNLYFHYRFVVLLENNQRHDEAAALIRAVAEAKPDEVQLKLWLVQYLVTHKDLPAAEQTLRNYIATYPNQFDLQIGLGSILVAQKKALEARAHYLSLVSDSEDSELSQRARLALAGLENSAGNSAKAEQWVAEVLELEPENPDALTMRANRLLRQGNYADAITQARTVLRNRPDSVPALSVLAEAHKRRNSNDLARDNLQQILNLAPQNQFALNNLAELALKAGDADEAQQYSATALRADPTSGVAARTLVAAYTAQGDTQLALAKAQELANSDTNKLLGTYLLGAVQYADKNYTQAAEQFQATLAIEPRVREALTGLVRSLLALEDKAAAETFLESFTQQHPNIEGAWLLQGDLLRANNNLQDAAANYERALAINAKSAAAYERLADIELVNDKTTRALAVINKGLKQLPDNIPLLLRRAQALEATGQIAEARAAYEQVLANNNDIVIARNNLAVLLTDTDGSDSALNRAVELMRPYATSSAPPLLDTLGWAYHKLGDQEQAVRYLQAAIDNGGADPTMYFHLGSALAAAGNTIAARQALESALAVNADFNNVEQAKTLLSTLL